MRILESFTLGHITGQTLFLLLLFLFLIGCVLGYGLEVLFRRFFTAKKWVNPGFMRGPWLPLYGFGLVIMFCICWVFYVLLPSSWHLFNPTGSIFGKEYYSGPTVYDLIPLLSMGIGMTLLEFIAGIIFVNGFKVRLWDYTNMKGNILGVICPLFSTIWLAVSVIFYYVIDPYMFLAAEKSFVFMFGDTNGGQAAHFVFIFFMGVFYGIMLIDFINSINLFNRISALAKQSGVIAKYEKLAEEQKIQRKEAAEKFKNALPEKIKKTLDNPKRSETTEKVSKKVKGVFLIDPDIKKTAGQNYDEKGRPVKINQEKDNQEK